MPFIENVTVSRKTPRDGKLEICAEFAELLGKAPGGIVVRMGDSNTARPAAVVTMPCGCAGPEQHVTHHFLQAEAFKSLTPESRVCLKVESEDPFLLHVTADRAHSVQGEVGA